MHNIQADLFHLNHDSDNSRYHSCKIRSSPQVEVLTWIYNFYIHRKKGRSLTASILLFCDRNKGSKELNSKASLLNSLLLLC